MEETPQSALEVIEQNAPNTATYMGALLIFMPVVPIVASIISATTYIGIHLDTLDPKHKPPEWGEGLLPLLVGTGVALVLWFLLAYFCRRFTAVHRASEKSYYALLNHLSSVNYYINAQLPDDDKRAACNLQRYVLKKKPERKPTTPTSVGLSGGASPQPAVSAPPGAASMQATSISKRVQEVLHFRDAIYIALMHSTTSWIVGDGYVELWDLMDSAEEALISVAPLEKVIGDAVYDEMRLNDSKIANSEEWTNKLRSAVKGLDADAVRYLKPAIGTQSPILGTGAQPPGANAQLNISRIASFLPYFKSGAQKSGTQKSGAQQQDSETNQEEKTETQQQAEARAILRNVRETINNFNAKSFDALISARRQLLSTMFFVGLTAYAFVELALILQTIPRHVEVALIYAFIGGLTGLIGRLYIESQADTAIDDYRLSSARLMVTPLLSGLAAVLGVLVVAKTDNLNMIYSFYNFVPNLLIAATFGLTPNLLLNQLQKKSDGYKANLQSTQPTSGK